MIIAGIAALSFGLSGFWSFMWSGGMNSKMSSIAMFFLLIAVAGVVLIGVGIARSLKKGDDARNENIQKRMMGQGNCPACGLNLTAGCRRCPRCGQDIQIQ